MNHKHLYTDAQPEARLPYIGFDNSDKNKLRNSIGSCTDMIAAERRFFGPWQVPNANRQRRLVDRLAPHKPPAPPDPRFDGWVNHFKYYWDIGVDTRPERKPLGKSLSNGAVSKVDSSAPENLSGNQQNKLHVTSYHRILRRQTLDRFQVKDSPDRSQLEGGEESDRVARKYTSRFNNTLGPINELYYRRRYRDSDSGQGTVPGLDRRYMGLQVIDQQQLEDLIKRLTQMTSAYKAKFSPNPHVWVDTSPGAHMVIKRENTIG